MTLNELSDLLYTLYNDDRNGEGDYLVETNDGSKVVNVYVLGCKVIIEVSTVSNDPQDL